ncbi:MAG: PQQ-binding-like beta-propeller repeat protein, partial [Planctomycetes bacterium]|nr:PQQ-binding-like beta-propeller repeat protein [Planctomycetota bacterium]
MPDSAIVAYPAVTPDFIYVNDGFRVRQLDPVTGDERAVFSGSLTDQDISRFQTAFRNNYIRLNGLFGVTLAGGKLFANIIRPSTNPALRNSYLPVSSVIALSAVSLKKLWSTDDLNDPFLSDINLFSPPIVSGQQVIVAGIKQIGVEAQVYLFSFDINTGSLRWKKFICSRMRRNRRRGRVNLVTPLLAEDKGLVFCNTNHGVVAAVVADSGSIVWLVNYTGELSPVQKKPNQQPIQLSTLNYPIINKTVLCCLPDVPADRKKKFFAFDAFTGRRLRSRPFLLLKRQVTFLGLKDDAVFFSGGRLPPPSGDLRDRLFSSYLLNDKIQWGPFPSSDSELSMNLTGPGFLTEKCAYLNTKEGLIVVDLETKELKGPQAWAAPGRVRLMMTTQHGLLTVSDENISLYHDLERFLAEFKKEADLYPIDLKLLLNKYIQPLIDNQKIDQAIKSLVELKRRIDSAGLPIEERPVFDALVSKLMPLYALKGQRSFQAGKFEAAIKFWRAEQVLAREPSDLARINFRLAECAMATKSWAEALTLFQGVLVKYPGEYYEPLTGDKNRWRLKSNLYAARQIEAMIVQVGREIYQPVEKEARQFARRLDLKNPTDCLKFLETYPNSRRTNEVVFWLARRAHERGDHKDSLRWLRFL